LKYAQPVLLFIFFSLLAFSVHGFALDKFLSEFLTTLLRVFLRVVFHNMPPKQTFLSGEDYSIIIAGGQKIIQSYFKSLLFLYRLS